MPNLDSRAQAVLEMLAGLARCPHCREISRTGWTWRDRRDIALCPSDALSCPVVAFRKDGAVVLLNDNFNLDGTWIWREPRRR